MNPKYQKPVTIAPPPNEFGPLSHVLNAAAALIILVSLVQTTSIAGFIA